MFFSIIVPVYNSQSSLNRCLDSIISQTFTDFEVILINDGSSDKSLDICYSFAMTDKRFGVINQINQGPSSARNEGLRIAEGKFICFIDSDDYICEDYLETLHKTILTTQVDVVFFGYYLIDKSKIKKMVPPLLLPEENPVEIITQLSDADLFGYTWIKCFSKKAIGTNRFESNISLFEDEIFTCRVLRNCHYITAIPTALYNYVTTGSQMLTKKTFPNYCRLSEKVYMEWKEILSGDKEYEKKLKSKAESFIDRCIYYGLEHNVKSKEFFNDLRNTLFFTDYHRNTIFENGIYNGKWMTLRFLRIRYCIRVFISSRIVGPIRAHRVKVDKK